MAAVSVKRSIHFGDVCEALIFRFFASLFKAFRYWGTARSKESKDVKAWLNFWSHPLAKIKQFFFYCHAF